MATRHNETFSDLFKAIALTNFKVGSRFNARLTHLVDPHDFYVIPSSLIPYLALISKSGDPVQTTELKEDMVVIFTSKEPDVNYYLETVLDENIRGIIQNVDSEKNCQIYALDRGFTEYNVSADRIFHLGYPEALSTPSLVQHCELDMCAPIGPHFSEEAIDALKFYMGNELLSILVRENLMDKLRVVVDNSNPDDVATLLALTHYTCLSSSVRNDFSNTTGIGCSHPKVAPVKHLTPKSGDVFQVRVQSGASLNSFYVSPLSSYKKYLDDRADFTNYCKSKSEIELEDFLPGALVGVKDNMDIFYERAVILEVLESNSIAKVKLIDWGSEYEVPIIKIKPIKTELYKNPPAHALYCSAVKSFVPWDNGLNKFLYKGYTFSITIETVGNGFEIPHIVSIKQGNF